MEIIIRPITQEDQAWITRQLIENWVSPLIISRGKSHDASKLPGFVALINDTHVGLVTYRIDGLECELVTLDSWRENMGVGTTLIQAAKEKAILSSCVRLWVITTNDNLKALRFYQKRGFHLVTIYPNSISKYRKIKPTIPQLGFDDIPIRDEIELQIMLDR